MRRWLVLTVLTFALAGCKHAEKDRPRPTRDDLPLVGVDNLPGSVPIETITLPRRCVLVFGQEGPGLSEPARAACTQVCSITMFGSTRSINAGVASGIAMHTWIRQHAL